MRITLVYLFFVISSLPVWAGTVSIDLEDKNFMQMPASDLVYKEQQIDEVDALEIKKAGFDLSQMNPVESKLWNNKKFSVQNYKALEYPKEVNINFKNFKQSPREFFRATVTDSKDYKKQYVISASLENHTNILRAALLRLLGYDLDVPKFYKEMTIKFSSKDEKNQFIELVGEQTLTKREKWIVKDLSDTKLIIKGFTLEPAEIRNVNIHLPIMARERQQDRRVFRALLDIYMLTDFTQKVNEISWKVGRVFNNKLIFNHPYASEFRNTTIDDLKWIHRKVTNLTRKEIEEALKLSEYPEDIQSLLLEKLLARINNLSEYYKLNNSFPVNHLITYGNIVNGKLTSGDYPNYVIEFYVEDPENPYRFTEIFRLFKTQLIYSSLSGALDTAMQKVIPGIYNTDAVEDIGNQIANFRRDNPSANGILPYKAFASPILNGRLFTSRNIVFGQYLGSSAPIQLVDSVGAEASLGVYTNLTGLPNNVLPSFGASASIGRAYIHVRPMPDLKTASKQDLRKLFVPGLMKKLGRVIKDEYECSVPEKAYKEETELNGEPLYYIKYDKTWKDGKENAIKLRQDLIDSGVSASIILLVVINRETLCFDEIAKTRKESMVEFVKEFALNETFIINDSIRFVGNINAPIPVPNLPGATISIGTEHNLALLKSVMLRKTDTGMEVTISQQKNLKNGLKEGFNFYVEILSNSNQLINGKMTSKVHTINLEDLDDDKLTKALKTLRAVFVSNDHELMRENYPSKDLDHKVLGKLNTFKLLWFKAERMKMDHTVTVIIPNKEDEEYSLAERTRNLYSTFFIKRKGNDFHSFLDRAINSLTGFISIGSNNGDPGQTFMGRGEKTSYITESELTDGRPLEATTKIEFSWTGWKKKTKKLEKYFSEIEEMYSEYTDQKLIDRTLFYNTSALSSYDIRSTLILYPESFTKLKQYIFEAPELHAINSLYNLYGHQNWQDYCDNAISFFGESGPQQYRGEKNYNCVPASVQKLLRLRNKLPKDRKKLTNTINDIFKSLFEDFEKKNVLKWLGKENFFASNRITGFRENHNKGYLEYISDTLGEYNPKYGTGLFDQIGTYIGVSPYELRAMSYTPGM